MSESRRVLHVVARLLTRTETFIREQLVGAEFSPHLLAWAREPDGLKVDVPARFLRITPPFLPTGVRGRARAMLSHLEVVKVLRALHPDVVHAHFGPTGIVVERACRRLGIPLVVSFYGYDAMPSFAPFYRRLFQTASNVILEGPHFGKTLVGLGAREESLALLPLCLPEWAEREPPPRLDPALPVLRLLQIARHVPKKGIPTTLRAVAEARAAGVGVELTLIGDGPMTPELRTLASELGIASVIKFVDRVQHESVPKLLAESHAIIQPSEVGPDGDTEGGAPTVLIEAQAQGVPILGSTHADIPYVVSDGVTGLLTAERDHAALAQSILRVARDPQLLERLSVAARPFVLSRHGRAQALRAREDIYRSALASPESMKPQEYWEWRARKYGKRAVLDLRERDVDEVTARQKEFLFPLLQRELTGTEGVILDVGCGPGRFTPDLANAIGGRALGIDTVQRFLDLAPAAERVEYARMSEGAFPAESASVDVVWICLVLGGITASETLALTAAEVDRVLKPTGLLFLVETTEEGSGSAHWQFRSFADYGRLFPFIQLRHLGDYESFGERVSVMAGRRVSSRQVG